MEEEDKSADRRSRNGQTKSLTTILLMLALTIVILDTVHVRYVLWGMDRDLSTKIDILTQRETKLQRRVSTLEFYTKTKLSERHIFLRRENVRSRRHVIDDRDQAVLKATQTLLAKFLSDIAKSSAISNNSTCTCAKPRITNRLPMIRKPESSTVSLYCEATGNPRPVLKWTFSGRKIDQRYTFPVQGGLQISNIRRKDSGKIQCVAENSIGQDMVETALDVQFRPTIHIQKKTASTISGGQLQVTCEVTGNPKPTIRWQKDSGKMNGLQRLSEGGMRLKLNLTKAGLIDSGIYTCVASNNIGSVSDSIDIQVKEEISNCATWRKKGYHKSGTYTINPGRGSPFGVFCDMTTNNQGWTVIQRRIDGKENFLRGWNDYKNGFGDINREFWVGNDKIHQITAATKMAIRFDLEDTQGNKAYAEYDSFSIDSEKGKYKLHLGKYKGTAGDSFSSHNGQSFSTVDQDNDLLYNGHCAIKYSGAWWYSACHNSNLNGKYLKGAHTSYADGVEWYTWKGQYYSLAKTEIKLRPKN